MEQFDVVVHSYDRHGPVEDELPVVVGEYVLELLDLFGRHVGVEGCEEVLTELLGIELPITLCKSSDEHR